LRAVSIVGDDNGSKCGFFPFVGDVVHEASGVAEQSDSLVCPFAGVDSTYEEQDVDQKQVG